MRRFLPGLWLVLLLAAGCGGAGGSSADALASDAAPDAVTPPDAAAPTDARAETAPVADAVAGPDGSLDVAPDVAVDVPPDVPLDAPLDAPPDVPLDAPPDVPPDVPADLTPDVGPPWDPLAPPPALAVTVNRVPAAMNGSVPYLGPDRPETAFRLLLPTSRFTVDVTARPAPGGPPADWDSLTVALAVAPADGGAPFERAVAPAVAPDGRSASWQVPVAEPLPEGALTITATLADVLGRDCGPAAPLTVELRPLAAHLDPFPQPDPWLVTFGRDEFALTLVEAADGTFDLEATHTPGGNGVPDFDEAFLAMGLFSSDPEVTAIVRERLVARIRQVANGIFGLAPDGTPLPDGVPLRLWFEGDPGAPALADGPGVAFSHIAVGGDGDEWDIRDRIVGRAWLDPNNQEREDDGVYGLGVFTTQIVRMVLRNPAGWMLLRELSPVVGTPIGLDPDDARILAPDFDPAHASPRVRLRHGLLTLAIDTGGLATASTLAHEMGHSLGLVPPGVPPRGLFAGIPGLPFVDSESEGWHIDTPGLNVMQTGSQTNWIEAAHSTPRFGELNLAYLRRRLVVDPGAAAKAGEWPRTAPRCGCAAPADSPASEGPSAPPLARYPVMDLVVP